MRTLFLSCVFFFCSGLSVFAQAVNTTTLYDYYSKSPLITIIGNTVNICITVGDNGVILRSSDNGKTWEQLTQFSGYSFVNGAFFDKNNCCVVGHKTAAPDFAAFYSTDAGMTWTESQHAEPISVSSFTDLSLIGLTFTNSGTATACTGSGTVIRTDDYGKTWKRISTFDTQSRLTNVIVHTNDTTLHSFRDMVYHRSTDNGITWKSMPAIAANGRITSAYVHNSKLSVAVNYPQDNSVTFLESSDNGDQWTVKSVGTNLDEVSKVLIIDSLTIVAICTNVKSGLYLSTNNGHSWVSYLEGQGPIQFNDIYFTDTKTMVVIGDKKSVYIVDLPGKTATVISSAPNHTSTSNIFVLRKNPDNSILFCDFDSSTPCISTDDGSTWNHNDSIFGISAVTDIYYRTKEHGYALIYSQPGLFFETKDGGKTWGWMSSISDKSYTSPYYVGRCFSFVDEKTGVALVKKSDNTQAIISTNDSGATWQEASDSSYYFFYPELKRFGMSDMVYAVSAVYNEKKEITGQEMAVSSDYGKSWMRRPIMDSIAISAFHVFDSSNIIVVGRSSKKDSSNHGRIFRTTDGGASWLSILKDNSFSFPWTIAVEKNVCIVGGHEQDSVLISFDYGFTWKGYFYRPTSKTDPARYSILNSLIKDGEYYACARQTRSGQSSHFIMKFNIPEKSTSIKDIENTNEYHEFGISAIKPNPATGAVTASIFHDYSIKEPLRINLYSSQGVLVRDLTSELQMDGSGNATLTFTTEGMSSGMYLLGLSCGGRTRMQLMPIIR